MIEIVKTGKTLRGFTLGQKSIIKSISEKEMDRKDFLKYSGVVLLSVIGLKGVVSLISQADKTVSTTQQTPERHGFGGGKYGA